MGYHIRLMRSPSCRRSPVGTPGKALPRPRAYTDARCRRDEYGRGASSRGVPTQERSEVLRSKYSWGASARAEEILIPFRGNHGAGKDDSRTCLANCGLIHPMMDAPNETGRSDSAYASSLHPVARQNHRMKGTMPLPVHPMIVRADRGSTRGRVSTVS